jgi:tRNA(adenine34) deaminase
MISDHEKWMKITLREAMHAMEKDEVPVGAVIVHEGKIIGKGYNQVEQLNDPTAHAEMIAITAAAASLQTKWLEKCILYVTMEPCAMCAGAIVLARIPTVVFGAYDPKTGACGTLFNILEDRRLNHSAHVIGGVCDEESKRLLGEFFKKKRLKQKTRLN